MLDLFIYLKSVKIDLIDVLAKLVKQLLRESEVRILCLVKLFESVNFNLNRCISVLCYQVTLNASHTTHLISSWCYTLHLKENQHIAPLFGELIFFLSYILGTRESLRLHHHHSSSEDSSGGFFFLDTTKCLSQIFTPISSIFLLLRAFSRHIED